MCWFSFFEAQDQGSPFRKYVRKHLLMAAFLHRSTGISQKSPDRIHGPRQVISQDKSIYRYAWGGYPLVTQPFHVLKIKLVEWDWNGCPDYIFYTSWITAPGEKPCTARLPQGISLNRNKADSVGKKAAYSLGIGNAMKWFCVLLFRFFCLLVFWISVVLSWFSSLSPMPSCLESTLLDYLRLWPVFGLWIFSLDCLNWINACIASCLCLTHLPALDLVFWTVDFVPLLQLLVKTLLSNKLSQSCIGVHITLRILTVNSPAIH